MKQQLEQLKAIERYIRERCQHDGSLQYQDVLMALVKLEQYRRDWLTCECNCDSAQPGKSTR